MSQCFKCFKELYSNNQRHGLHPSCYKEWFQLIDAQEEFKNLNPHGEDFLDNESFFQGAFKKYSAFLGHTHYILKTSTVDYPELARTEYLCNQIAGSLHLPIPDHFLISFLSTDCFVTYNFMQHRNGCDLKHIYHFLKKDDIFSIETFLTIIEEKTGRHSESVKFLQMCLFDALIGNHDRHGRNFGFIVSSNGYELSPLYDNPSYFAIEDLLEADFGIGGKITTRQENRSDMIAYVEDFCHFGYRDEVRDFFAHIPLDTIENLIKVSFISERRKKALLNFIHKRYRDLENAI